MSKTSFTRPNALGDLRAEADRNMLDRAFLETADYRTLIETSDRIVVVGRRGTGKSALTWRLEQHCRQDKGAVVVKIAPEEHQTIGLRPRVGQFGSTFNRIRAGSRLLWRYALAMEATCALMPTYRFENIDAFRDSLKLPTCAWRQRGTDIFERLLATIRETLDRSLPAEEQIELLPRALDLTSIERSLSEAAAQANTQVVFLIDRLDEGYEADDRGIGIIDGLVQAAIDLKTRCEQIKPIVFLRDNIFRAVQQLDPDYSRNIEGHVLRLHWDADALFTFATKRLRLAFNLEPEADLRIWNSRAAGHLRGKPGFNLCLQKTLYRPRDLLSLLNEAFYVAGSAGQEQLIPEHIEAAGRTISQNRLDDLRKEYEAILPGLPRYIAAFHGKPPEYDLATAYQLIENLLSEGSDNSVVQQDFFIIQDSKSVIRGLYSVGFLGIRDGNAGAFVFCHDGRAPDHEFESPDKILIHPCYWMALNCAHDEFEQYEAEDIYDEYDITVSSETPQIRNERIRELIASLDKIPEGVAGANDFEQWCHAAIRICFAKGLRNVELKPNKQAKTRRGVVATNLGDGPVWRRIYEDYQTRQVIFEVKNFEDLEASHYHQAVFYLTGEYGRLAFFVTRADTVNLAKDKDVDWVREVHSKHNCLVIKLTGKYLANLLDKLRKPAKHDVVNNAINSLLDTYVRLYVEGQTKADRKEMKRAARQRKKERWKANKQAARQEARPATT